MLKSSEDLFAAVLIPKPTPSYSDIVNDFAFGTSEQKPRESKIAAGEFEYYSEKTFHTCRQAASGRPSGARRYPGAPTWNGTDPNELCLQVMWRGSTCAC